jgi:hypothetical protein
MLAAVFVTAILITLVGTTLMPVPADSYVNMAGFARMEPLLVRQARTVKRKEQSRMLGYARRTDKLNGEEPADSTSSIPETVDGGTSSYPKTQVRHAEGPAERAADSSASGPASERPTANSDKHSVDVAVTSSVNNPSIPKSEPPAPPNGTAASSVAGPNVAGRQCGTCARNDCQWRGLARPRSHAHYPRPQIAGWRRISVSHRAIARYDARRAQPPAYSSF